MSPVVVLQEADPSQRQLWRSLLAMAGPTIGSGWLKSSYALADTLVAGRISTGALAALSTAVLFVWMFHSMSATNAVGALSRISQATGANATDAARSLLRRALTFALLMGTVVSGVFGLLVPVLLPRLGIGEAVAADARAYLWTVIAFGPAFWALDTLEQSFRGRGDARTPLWITGIFAILNLGLNPILALGFAGLPALGLMGVALATGFSWTGGAVWLFVIARRRGWLRRSSVPAPRAIEIWKVGLPTAMAGVAFDTIFLFLVPILAQSGPAALAAVAVGHRLESVAYLTAQGLGISCASLVGQAVGMRQNGLARRIAFQGAFAALVFSALSVLVMLVLGQPLYRLFSDDAAVIELGQRYIQLAGIAVVLQGVEVVVLGAFSGTGRTALPNALVFLAYAARVPLALALAPILGTAGVFLAIGLTAGTSGILVSLLFWRVGAKNPDVLYASEVAG